MAPAKIKTCVIPGKIREEIVFISKT